MRDITNSTKEKPTYKDYKNFLQNYKRSASPDNSSQGSSSLSHGSSSLSQTSSSSSLQSADAEGPKTYNEFLQSYGSKKFGSVRVKLPEKEQKKSIKSEIFINISQPDEVDLNFSQIKNKFNSKHNGNPPVYKSQNSVGNYKNGSDATCTSPHKLLSPKSAENHEVPDQMIYAKTAVLEELLSSSPTLRSPIKFDNVQKTTNSKSEMKEILSNGNFDSIPPPPTTKPPILPKNFPQEPSNVQNSYSAPMPPPLPISPPPTLSKVSNDLKVQKDVQREDELMNELRTLILAQERSNLLDNIPEPPKFITQQLQAKYSEPTTTTVIPVTDPHADVDKSHPTVKKAVYNTYRGLLGAYNNKANGMVSTLPRNAVVQDQGVSKQLESISSQGCLDRLNGRVNPKSSED